MKRKIINISHYTGGDAESIYSTLYALCNDGTIWYWDDNKNKWWLLPTKTIPQDKVQLEVSDDFVI